MTDASNDGDNMMNPDLHHSVTCQRYGGCQHEYNEDLQDERKTA